MRRFAVTLAALALSLAASPALAQGRPSFFGTALLGFEDGEGDAGVSLRFDGELVQRPLAPGVGFSIVGSIGFTRFSEDYTSYDPYYDVELGAEWAANVFKIVPAARLTFGRSANLHPYVDAGLGLYYASVSATQTAVVGTSTYPYYRIVEAEGSDSETSLMMRFAAGLTFDVSPTFALGGELGFNPYFGDVDDTMLSLMLAARFRL